MAKVLVLGASGYVGSHLIPPLVERRHEVRAAGRREDTLDARGWEGVETVRADALAAESLAQACEGIELVYYLIHSMASGRGSRSWTVVRRHMCGTRRRAPEWVASSTWEVSSQGKRLRYTWPPGERPVRCCDPGLCR